LGGGGYIYRYPPVATPLLTDAAHRFDSFWQLLKCRTDSITCSGFVVQLVVQQAVQQIHNKSDYHVTSLLFLRVTCPCSLRTYATLKFIRSSSSSSSNRKPTASPQQKSTTSCTTISKSYSKSHNLLYDKFTANRIYKVRHLGPRQASLACILV